MVWTSFEIDVINSLVVPATCLSGTAKSLAKGWWPTHNFTHPPVSRPGPQFSHSAWHAWWIIRLQLVTWHKTRLGPLQAELNTHAPTDSQSHLARTEVLPETSTILFDVVGISDVPVTSGFNVKPPIALLASAELGNVVAATSGNVAATAFNDALARHVDDENAAFVHGDITENVAGLAFWEATCPAACAPCTCVRRFDGCHALWRGGLICVLDNMVCMNSVIKLMVWVHE